MKTVLIDINSRPLTTNLLNEEAEEALTPSHLVIGIRLLFDTSNEMRLLFDT